MDIVIGYQGKDHVKAEQLRRLIAGMAGDGTYVLGTQNELAATMVTANQVRIDTGDIVAAGGAYATVETPETLTIESGATGQKRNDLVVARYEKNASTSVESMELAVVKGTAVSFGDPSDPEVQDGSIIDGDSPVEVPLWRIPIDGLAPGTPVALFETIPTIDSLRDSVSQRIYGADDSALGIWLYTCGTTGIVQLSVRGTFNNSDYTELASLPEGVAGRLLVPPSGQYSAVCGYNAVSGVAEPVVCFVNSSGVISVRPATTVNSVFGSFAIILS